ncbi:aromatic-ring-hydroxylating dioxygenase subunit beta [soil metagenome]
MTPAANLSASRRSRTSWGPFDAQAVWELYDDYAALLDDGEYEAWLDLFVADATYSVTSRENVERDLPLATIRCDSRAMLADRIEALTSTQFYARRIARHMISAIRPVAVDAQSVEVTANFVVFETLVDEATQVHSAGTYADRVIVTDDGPRFAVKVAVYDAPLVPTSLIVPL